MGVAKSDFSQMRRSRSDLIKNAECFARIDLDRSRSEKERNQSQTKKMDYVCAPTFNPTKNNSSGAINYPCYILIQHDEILLGSVFIQLANLSRVIPVRLWPKGESLGLLQQPDALPIT